MKIREIIDEMVIGKPDPEHEKIVKERDELLNKKIKDKLQDKEKVLRRIENLSDRAIFSEITSDPLTTSEFERVMEFLNYATERLREYAKEVKKIKIPIAKITDEVGANLLVQEIQMDKMQMKLLTAMAKKMGDADFMSVFKKVKDMTPDELRKSLGKDVPGLDVEDLEDFYNRFSKDTRTKNRIAKINKGLSRLASKVAENKYLSSIKETGKINL